MSNPLIVLCSGISTLLPFLAGIFIFKHSIQQYKRSIFLWVFFALAALVEAVLFILGTKSEQSAWIFHVYTLIEYVLIAIILADWHNKIALARLTRLSILVFILIFALMKFSSLENFSAVTHNYITRPLAVLLLSTFAFLTLQNLWSRTPARLTADYRFWMLLAMVLYYSASLALFAFMFTKDQQTLIALFKIHAVVNILHNILFTIGVFKLRGAKQGALQPEPAS